MGMANSATTSDGHPVEVGDEVLWNGGRLAVVVLAVMTHGPLPRARVRDTRRTEGGFDVFATELTTKDT